LAKQLQQLSRAVSGQPHAQPHRRVSTGGQPLRHDLGHDLVAVVDALAAVKAQRKSEQIGEVVQ